MESAYVIKRDGPDGTKYFNVQNTTSEMCPVSTTDSTTSKTKSTFYAYSVAPLIDQYDISDNIGLACKQPSSLIKRHWMALASIPVRFKRTRAGHGAHKAELRRV